MIIKILFTSLIAIWLCTAQNEEETSVTIEQPIYMLDEDSSQGIYDTKGNKKGLWTTWYSNGLKKKECTYTRNKYNDRPELIGLYTTWYPDGQMEERCTYTANISRWDDFIDTIYGPEGLYTAWYSNGQKREEGFYIYSDRRGSIKKGLWIQWRFNGIKANEVVFNDYGLKESEICWYKNGKKSLESNDSANIRWNENNHIISLIRYYNKNSEIMKEHSLSVSEFMVMNGIVENIAQIKGNCRLRASTQWYENRNKESEDISFNIRDGTSAFSEATMVRLCKQWYENGFKKDETFSFSLGSKTRLKEEDLSIRDTIEEHYKSWYPNGKPERVRTLTCLYNNSEHIKTLDNKTQRWYKSGKKWEESNDSVSTRWYENGKKRSEDIKGKTFTEWDEDGKIKKYINKEEEAFLGNQ